MSPRKTKVRSECRRFSSRMSALIGKSHIAVVAIAFGLAVWPDKAAGMLRLDGSDDQDFKNLAAQFSGTSLWLEYLRPDGSTGHVSAVRFNNQFALTAAHNLTLADGSQLIPLQIGTG